MAIDGCYSLTEIARRLDVPQHRLIHLCEKGVVVPEIHDAAGRGSSRTFSTLNYLELAISLRLRDMFVPVSVLPGVIHVVRTFGEQLRRYAQDLPAVEYLRQPDSPELRIILSDGRLLFFSLLGEADSARVFGGVPLESLRNRDAALAGCIETAASHDRHTAQPSQFGQPEGSEFVRLELSVNAIARSLDLD